MGVFTYAKHCNMIFNINPINLKINPIKKTKRILKNPISLFI